MPGDAGMDVGEQLFKHTCATQPRPRGDEPAVHLGSSRSHCGAQSRGHVCPSCCHGWWVAAPRGINTLTLAAQVTRGRHSKTKKLEALWAGGERQGDVTGALTVSTLPPELNYFSRRCSLYIDKNAMTLTNLGSYAVFFIDGRYFRGQYTGLKG